MGKKLCRYETKGVSLDYSITLSASFSRQPSGARKRGKEKNGILLPKLF
jgi:hypothetical protein